MYGALVFLSKGALAFNPTVKGGGGDLKKFSCNGVTKDMVYFSICT